MLVTDRRRGFGMHDEDDERDALQGSLFAPESLAPPRRHERPPGPTPDPFRPAPREPEDTRPAPDLTDAPAQPVDVPEYAEVAGVVEVAPPAAAPHSGDAAPPRRRAAPLSGPTLDDVTSRVWEGMRAEVPTPCPVCRTEVEPSMGGRCGSCGSALD